LDASVGLFPTQGPGVGHGGRHVRPDQPNPALVGSIYAAAASGLGGGLTSVAVLAFGWTLLTNGSAIVFCPPPCPVAAPLADVAHLGSLGFGLAATVGAVRAVWQRRLRPAWRLPAVAAALVLAAIVALANAA
jgi:hypothetical protein